MKLKKDIIILAQYTVITCIVGCSYLAYLLRDTEITQALLAYISDFLVWLCSFVLLGGIRIAVLYASKSFHRREFSSLFMESGGIIKNECVVATQYLVIAFIAALSPYVAAVLLLSQYASINEAWLNHVPLLCIWTVGFVILTTLRLIVVYIKNAKELIRYRY